jgi:hypothetical protein
MPRTALDVLGLVVPLDIRDVGKEAEAIPEDCMAFVSYGEELTTETTAHGQARVCGTHQAHKVHRRAHNTLSSVMLQYIGIRT